MQKTTNQWGRPKRTSQAELIRRRILEEKMGEYVYFIVIGEKFVKIGRSQNPRERILTWCRGTPFSFRTAKIIKGGNESSFHQRFAHLREKTEWFRYEADLKDFCDRDGYQVYPPYIPLDTFVNPAKRFIEAFL